MVPSFRALLWGSMMTVLGGSFHFSVLLLTNRRTVSKSLLSSVLTCRRNGTRFMLPFLIMTVSVVSHLLFVALIERSVKFPLINRSRNLFPVLLSKVLELFVELLVPIARIASELDLVYSGRHRGSSCGRSGPIRTLLGREVSRSSYI